MTTATDLFPVGTHPIADILPCLCIHMGFSLRFEIPPTFPVVDWERPGKFKVRPLEAVRTQTDAILPALLRMKSRMSAEFPDCSSRLLLIESDIRSLPLASESCDLVLAIEVLCLLNEQYELGIGEQRLERQLVDQRAATDRAHCILVIIEFAE